MSTIELAWHPQHPQILVFTFQSNWGWTDFYAAGDASNEMMDAVDFAVVEIFDMRKAHGMPPNIIMHGRTILNSETHPRLEALILVGVNSYLMAIYKLFERILPPSILEKWNIVLLNDMDAAIDRANEILGKPLK